LPEALWTRAVEVARVHGAERTARATRLRPERLRQQMQAGGGHSRVLAASDERSPERSLRGANSRRSAATRETVGAARVEHSGGARFVAVELASAPRSGSLVIDLVGRDGHRMRVETTETVDLSGLVQAFWSRQP
jgi:hypothetical protein